MSLIQRRNPALRLTAALLISVTAGLLAGCANRDNVSTGALPDDYRTRHPIVIGENERSIDIPVAAGDRRLTQGTRDVVRGFASNYRGSASGTVQILLPSGSHNSMAAQTVSREIRAIFVEEGVSGHQIAQAQYQASASGDAAPIRLSFSAITAKAGPCGEWPEDLVVNTIQNKNYYNFGCASQSNLAAQIANPMDLLGPRAMSPIDASQRAGVIDDYRDLGN